MEKIGVIGLGYVGLPLAVEFGKSMDVVGFDINVDRIEELKKGHDRTREVSKTELAAASKLTYSSNLEALRSASFFIVTVPTPVDEFKKPDLTPLVKASETVGKVLKRGDIVIYESTVYPGCTEEICAGLGKGKRLDLQQGLFLRLFTGADQSRRQGAQTSHDPQSDQRKYARGC